jgi:Ankyrin repeats (3 copies)
MIRRLALSAICTLLFTLPARAADTVLGAFVVNGKTHILKQVYVTRSAEPDSPTTAYLSVLVADVPVEPTARTTARLTELAASGKVHAVRVVWSEGLDRVIATPFAAGVDDNGQPTTGGAVIDLQAYDEARLKAKITSKMLGQNWHFNASISAAVVRVAVTDENRRDTMPVVAPTGIERETAVEKDGRVDPTADKRALGRLGYPYDNESFMQAVTDGNLEAVRLFLRLGTSPNVKDDGDNFALNSAVTMCTRDPQGDRLAILQAMLAAKATVDVKDMNGSTPLLWSVNAQCPTDFARALVAAGANVNVKAKGGGTPLMLAKVFNRADLVDLLVKAGAK